jgi:16S rRNA (cytosine1402-N4)-methyltransferase
VPVLLDEVLRFLAIRPGGIYVDATFGRGGHSRAILAELGPAGRLRGMDRDPDAVAAGCALALADSRFSIDHERYSRLRAVLERRGEFGAVDGVLLDIGISSPQVDDPRRGFSFRLDGPLDMRMDPGTGEPASAWLARADESEISGVLRRLGEEPAARKIARAICAHRAAQPIQRTAELAAIIAGVVRGEPGRHPATRSFQAIRLHVNQELQELGAALAAALEAMAIGGRLCVISFHSLEDRLVKDFIRDHSRVDPALASLPTVPASALPRMRALCRAVRPSADEIAANPRARSAVLRAAEKTR